jgi:hypothetical protein
MKKNSLSIIVFICIAISLKSQSSTKQDIKLGLIFQKTQSLYLENGIGADYSSDFLLNKQIHLKAGYLSSRFGSALGTNAIKQDNIIVGADWRFRQNKDLQILAGLNGGLLFVDYENSVFDVLPKSATFLSVETGLVYNFKFPISISLTVGYNLKSGNGIDIPGTLFPVFYKFGVFYKL